MLTDNEILMWIFMDYENRNINNSKCNFEKNKIGIA